MNTKVYAEWHDRRERRYKIAEIIDGSTVSFALVGALVASQLSPTLGYTILGLVVGALAGIATNVLGVSSGETSREG